MQHPKTPLSDQHITLLIVAANPTPIAKVASETKPVEMRVYVAETRLAVDELITSTRPNLVLLDANFPDTDPYELCRALSEQTTVVFLTNHLSAEMKLRIFDAGATDYLTQPIIPAELIAKLNLYTQTVSYTKPTAIDAELGAEMWEYYRALIESLPIAIFVKDIAGHFVVVNYQTSVLTGRSPVDMLGKTDFDINPPHLAQKYRKDDQVVIETGQILQMIEEHQNANGELRIVEVIKSPIYDSDANPVGLLASVWDITDRVAMENSLAESEERYRILFEGIQDSIFVHDKNANILDVNNAAVRQLGYTREELLNMKITELDRDDYASGFRERWKAQTTEGELSQITGFHITKEGQEISIDVNTKLIHFNGVKAVLAVSRDITDRKRMEDALRHNEEQLRTAQSLARLGSWTWDLADNTITWTDVLYHIFGVPFNTPLTFNDYASRVHPDDSQRITQEIQQNLADPQRDQFYLEHRIVRSDGTERYIWVQAHIVRDENGEALRLYGISQDVTDRTVIEQEKAEAQALLEAAIQHSPSAIIIANAPDGKIRLVNAAAFNIRGETNVSLTDIDIDEYASHWHTFYPNGTLYDSRQLPLSRAFLNGEVTQGEDLIIRTDSGEERWVLANAAPIYDEQGNIIAGIVVFTDTTEVKQAQQAQQEAELLRVELEKERELRELKSRFVSMVVHDFRNPISSIQFSLATLQHFWETLNENGRDEQFNSIVSQTEQMNHLIDNILLLGELEVVAANFTPLPRNIAAFCERIFKNFAQQPPVDIYEFSYSANNENIQCDIDVELLQRALVNLISNAIKYSPEGGHIEMNVLDEHPQVVITLKDEGIGIPTDDQEDLFKSFYRASNVGNTDGSGLGLAIVKDIIDLHQGTIRVESVVGSGTTFHIELPQS